MARGVGPGWSCTAHQLGAGIALLFLITGVCVTNAAHFLHNCLTSALQRHMIGALQCIVDRWPSAAGAARTTVSHGRVQCRHYSLCDVLTDSLLSLHSPFRPYPAGAARTTSWSSSEGRQCLSQLPDSKSA